MSKYIVCILCVLMVYVPSVGFSQEITGMNTGVFSEINEQTLGVTEAYDQYTNNITLLQEETTTSSTVDNYLKIITPILITSGIIAAITLITYLIIAIIP